MEEKDENNDKKIDETKLTKEQYMESFPLNKEMDNNTIRKRAFEKAWEIRNYEIKLYWQRATYFWGFIAVTFAGYLALITSDNFVSGKINPELEFVVICLGLMFSISWIAVNYGSKYWQQNWEGHIDKLEDEFTGPLYKTVKETNFNFSVSKVNILVSWAIMIIWLILGGKYFNSTIDIRSNKTGDIAIITIISSVFMLGFIITLFIFGKTHERIKSRNNDYMRRK